MLNNPTTACNVVAVARYRYNMKILKLEGRYFLVRHWLRWYLVRTPYKGRILWKELVKSKTTIDQ
jgi:hypothetical protein